MSLQPTKALDFKGRIYVESLDTPLSTIMGTAVRLALNEVQEGRPYARRDWSIWFKGAKIGTVKLADKNNALSRR